ncbi:tetratricopeptide repeat protein [Synechococcus sp. Cruz-9H2]|uniref:tetratricopeptide repeat protein n=1 Tax=unclassified Synechococcus TaxID=2626047 RepID=UPI0020CC6FE2|nr:MULTISPECIES: tetratricopeptide repeat protein [unclassified Synechococcus]MCP9818167.1 tetratricopeptide repeat protein [Synechococcus sp. Cruz-9H2]MCP9842333.1 tetratricopeptide repeat protein [Synechococcus sp. Edmonson 11F2]MCP9854563.1 tetratricopeptide repeat protein [Synechococcus sp. Cruz-9C9]MCP9861741.1 tetratricopeptide repeat protein [Synechococcus sp. Cruz-7E5]MCP9869075.1 tetratricopeptide repeat protein [Synechococcus sp. Cruz-7B9]
MPQADTLVAALARLHRRHGQGDHADALIAALLDQNPASSPALLALAEAKLQRDDLQQARQTYQQLLELDPGHLGARCAVELLKTRSQAWHQAAPMAAPPAETLPDQIQAAEVAYANGRFSAALNLFQQALILAPEDANLLAATARCHRQLGDHAKAERILQAVLERQPDQFAAVLGMGELRLSQGNQAAAIPWYRRAIERQPGNHALLRTLSQCLVAAQETQEAEQVLADALQLEPHDPELLSARIDLCQALGELEQALVVSSSLLRLPAGTSWHRLRHVGLLRQLGRLAEALSTLDAFDPGEDTVLVAHGLQARGVVERELGHLPESLKLLKAAVEKDPISPDHAVALASLFAEIGAFEEGLDMLQEAERRIGEVQGLVAQPWLQFSKVTLYRGAGDYEAALAIADGLSHDPVVGFHARLQRAALLMNTGDGRAAEALDSLHPVSTEQIRQACLSRSHWLKTQYLYDEALLPLETLLDKEPLDLQAAEWACLLYTLLMRFEEAQALFYKIRATKQASGNPRLVETAFHGLHRCLMEHFHTNRFASSRIRDISKQPPQSRLAPLHSLLLEEPDCSAAAISLLVAARLSGQLRRWRGPAEVSEKFFERSDDRQIPRLILQFWNSSEVPDGVRTLMQSWRLANPSYQHLVFDASTAREFIAEHSSDLVKEAYSCLNSPVLQSDLFRLSYLYAFGGIYADADDRCRHSLAPLVEDRVSLVLYQEEIGSIGNNFIAAAPRHPLIEMALEMAAWNILDLQGSNPWFITGPGVLSLCFCRLYGDTLSNPDLPAPTDVRILTQHELSRRVSMHLQTPVKVNEGSWVAPRGSRGQSKRLIQEKMAQRGALKIRSTASPSLSW